MSGLIRIIEVLAADVHHAFLSSDVGSDLAVEYGIPGLFRKIRQISELGLCHRDVDEEVCRIVVLKALDIPVLISIVLCGQDAPHGLVLSLSHALACHYAAECVEELSFLIVFDCLQLLMLVVVVTELAVREVDRDAVDAFSRIAAAAYDARLCRLSYLVELLIALHLLLIVGIL